jgi:hypothetical protein
LEVGWCTAVYAAAALDWDRHGVECRAEIQTRASRKEKYTVSSDQIVILLMLIQIAIELSR